MQQNLKKKVDDKKKVDEVKTDKFKSVTFKTNVYIDGIFYKSGESYKLSCELANKLKRFIKE